MSSVNDLLNEADNHLGQNWIKESVASQPPQMTVKKNIGLKQDQLNVTLKPLNLNT